jgi:DNA-binding NtrC family response regulator
MASEYFGPYNSTIRLIPERLIFGRSTAMQEVRKSVQGVADTSVPVLLTGEPGTGKEVIGREIHRLSPWRKGPFVRFSSGDPIEVLSNGGSQRNGALLPRGASSSSSDSGWTLFIKEVSELAAALQAKLLELFQDGSVKTGHKSPPAKSVRVICSSSANLEDRIASGDFRLGLFYCINVVTISVPPLRDRKEDVPDLVQYFFELSCGERACSCPRVPHDLLQLFCRHDWPGNIRELENCVRIFVNTDGNRAVVEAFLSKRWKPDAQSRANIYTGNPIPLKTFKRQLVEQAEKDLILRVLHQQRWNRKEAAKVLQVSYQTLLHKLKRVGLSRKSRTRSEILDEPVQE